MSDIIAWEICLTEKCLKNIAVEGNHGCVPWPQILQSEVKDSRFLEYSLQWDVRNALSHWVVNCRLQYLLVTAMRVFMTSHSRDDATFSHISVSIVKHIAMIYRKFPYKKIKCTVELSIDVTWMKMCHTFTSNINKWLFRWNTIRYKRRNFVLQYLYIECELVMWMLIRKPSVQDSWGTLLEWDVIFSKQNKKKPK